MSYTVLFNGMNVKVDTIEELIALNNSANGTNVSRMSPMDPAPKPELSEAEKAKLLQEANERAKQREAEEAKKIADREREVTLNSKVLTVKGWVPYPVFIYNRDNAIKAGATKVESVDGEMVITFKTVKAAKAFEFVGNIPDDAHRAIVADLKAKSAEYKAKREERKASPKHADLVSRRKAEYDKQWAKWQTERKSLGLKGASLKSANKEKSAKIWADVRKTIK